MDTLAILVFVGLTSVAAYGVGVKRLCLAPAGLRAALGEVFEWFGLTLVFVVLNVGSVVVVVLAIRLLTRGFVSIYLADSNLLLVCSFLQALLFHLWRQASERASPR